MEANGFTQFKAPAENANGEWYCRSVDKDYDGFYRFLVFNGPSRPYIDNVITNNEIVCDSFLRAVEELQFYYEYHKAQELYNDIMQKYWDNVKVKAATVIESQVMVFK